MCADEGSIRYSVVSGRIGMLSHHTNGGLSDDRGFCILAERAIDRQRWQ